MTITLTREEAQQVLDALLLHAAMDELEEEAIELLRARLAQPEPEPAAWLIADQMINSLQLDSIQRLIDRARHARMTDIKLRINGQDEWYEADWLKHLKRAAPPQREWQGLTARDLSKVPPSCFEGAIWADAKLKAKNA